MSGADRDTDSSRLAAESLARDDATGWFERLYAAAAEGAAVVPWDSGAPRRLLVEWTRGRDAAAAGRRAAVVGCGLGDDAEHVAGLRYETLAFDISASAVREARRRHPGTRVEYVTADLLDPPAAWSRAFDLVVESFTVQSLPRDLRAAATAAVRELVAPGGTLLVIAAARGDDDADDAGPPWPLTRAELDAFAAGGLEPVRVENLPDGDPPVRFWRAELRRRAD